MKAVKTKRRIKPVHHLSHLADATAIIQLRGLATVEKDDRPSPYLSITYFHFDYKPETLHVRYKSKQARDEMFNRLAKELTSRKSPSICC